MTTLVKINQILFFLFALFILFYYGASFLIPFTFGVFLATLMTPVANFFERLKIGRTVSALLSTLVVFIVVGGLLFLFTNQMTQFVRDLSTIEERLQSFFTNIQERILFMTGISHEEQINIIQDRSDEFLKFVQSQATSLVGNILNITLKFFLVLIYTFLLLLYRYKFLDFIMMYVEKSREEETKKFVDKISKVVFQYLWGRSQVMMILGVAYIITFLLFDIRYAILLTILGTVVTIIPYIGPFISGILPILFSILYGKSMNEILLFAFVILVIQLIESYYLEPVIIGKEVKLNPLVVIISIIIGGMIWGVAGMILFVPMFAVFRIFSNNSDGMEPVGFLVGNKMRNEM